MNRREYGSIYPMCLATLKKKLTESRIRDLKMLTTSEGDAMPRLSRWRQREVAPSNSEVR